MDSMYSVRRSDSGWCVMHSKHEQLAIRFPSIYMQTSTLILIYWRMFLAITRAKSINVFKREERIRRWGGTSRSESGINKHCTEILNWIKLQQLVQEAISFPTIPSSKLTKSGIVLKLTVPLRNSSRRKYDSHVLTNHSCLG